MLVSPSQARSLAVNELAGIRATIETGDSPFFVLGEDTFSALGWTTGFWETQNKRLCLLLGGISTFSEACIKGVLRKRTRYAC